MSRRDRARYIVSEYEARIDLIGYFVWTFAGTVGLFMSTNLLDWIVTAGAFAIAFLCFARLWRLV